MTIKCSVQCDPDKSRHIVQKVVDAIFFWGKCNLHLFHKWSWKVQEWQQKKQKQKCYVMLFVSCVVIVKILPTHLVTIAGWVTKTWVLGFWSAAMEKWGFKWQSEQNFASSFAWPLLKCFMFIYLLEKPYLPPVVVVHIPSYSR